MNDPNELLDIGQAAKLLNVSETSLRRWTNSGKLRCMRVGHRRERRFRREDLLSFLEGHPSDISPGTGSTSQKKAWGPEGPVTITRGNHLVGFYGSDLGRITLAIPFLLDGLEEGSACFLVGPAAARKEIIKYLKKKRPSLQADIDAARLISSNYHPTGEEQCEYFCSMIEERIAAGVQSFRVIGDTWGSRSQMSAESFLDYEAGYDRFVAQKYPVVTICVFDVRKFSGVEVLNALKGHRDSFRYPLERALA